ncbi:MAG: peptidase dimerization domain-containing protein, partial [Lachnospiraceae bacterium]|nr:peptidase dimerization domain-containing protein [Lachnospiraceae bacterium]
ICSVRITGLKGGHSGDEIDKGRANASYLMASLLSGLFGICDLRLISIEGGSKDNAITRECNALISIPADKVGEAEGYIKEIENGVRGEYHGADPDIRYILSENGEGTPLTRESTLQVLRLLTSLPNGVIRMSDDIPGLVETSLNLGILHTVEDELVLGYPSEAR